MIRLNLSEKRLIILYILYKFQIAINQDNLTEIILETTPIKWLEVQPLITELIQNQLIDQIENKLEISGKGYEIVENYQSDILISIRENIDQYYKKNLDKITSNISIVANFKKVNQSYSVHLFLSELNESLLELTLSVPTREMAESICTKFKKDTTQIYRSIIKILE